MFKLFKDILLFCAFFVALVNCSSDYETCEKSDSSCGSSQKSFISRHGDLKHINIVLFGATGDLSKKYLWKSLLQTYEHYLQENKDYKFSIYAISRDEKVEGRKFLSQFFLNLPKCHNEKCSIVKKKFSESVQYVKIVTIKDILSFEALIDENTQSLYGMLDSQRSVEVGRLFYLAIPPSAYLKTIKRIRQHLMPKFGRPWIRIVLEKPFGVDLESVDSLSNQLDSLFNDSQIYRVDHYLGKSVVQEILSFRTINDDSYTSLWSNKHIKRVEVVLKEDIAVVGRTNFYNDIGVIRDVLQSHVTELLMLIGMEKPEEGGASIRDIHLKKLEVLRELRVAGKNKIITGQYSTYNKEWLAENAKLDEVTDTPTFAATIMHIHNHRWQGVPWVLVAGKKLNEKASYVRVVFKKKDGDSDEGEDDDDEEESEGHWKGGEDKTERQLLFYVDGKLGPFIAASKDLPEIKFKKDWRLVQSLGVESSILGTPQKDLNIYVPSTKTQPYVEVLKGVIDASRHMFVPQSLLRESWRVWDELLKESFKKSPRKYLGLNKDGVRLAFRHSIENGVEFEYDENYSETNV